MCRENLLNTGIEFILLRKKNVWKSGFLKGVLLLLLGKVWTVVDSCWKDRTSQCSFDEYNGACMRLLARSTVTGNSWQQECSGSLLICLHRAQLHYWLAAFFIQQLPVNKSHSNAPSHPPPLISQGSPSDLHMCQNNRSEPTWKGHCCISESDFRGHWPAV